MENQDINALPDTFNKMYQNLDHTNPGLENGMTGVAIISYILSQKLKKQEYSELADLLIDKVLDSITKISDVSFSHGITGIGWAICYLIQEKMIEGEASIFSKMDEFLYKYLLTNQHDISSILDIGFYFSKRMEMNSEQSIPEKQLRFKRALRICQETLEGEISKPTDNTELLRYLSLSTDLFRQNITRFKTIQLINAIQSIILSSKDKLNEAENSYWTLLQNAISSNALFHLSIQNSTNYSKIIDLEENIYLIPDNYHRILLSTTHQRNSTVTNKVEEKAIPVYAINIKERTERREHILHEFDKRIEFEFHLIEANTHTKGTIGLWNSMVGIIKMAKQRKEEFIIICEDDHYFTRNYSAELLLKEIHEAQSQNADILSGGIGGFGQALPVGYRLYKVDWFWCTQFIVVYNSFFNKVLTYTFKDDDTADGVFSELAQNKMVIYPFISEQKDFGYSDVTPNNMNNKGLIREHFAWANAQFKTIENKYQINHKNRHNTDRDKFGNNKSQAIS